MRRSAENGSRENAILMSLFRKIFALMLSMLIGLPLVSCSALEIGGVVLRQEGELVYADPCGDGMESLVVSASSGGEVLGTYNAPDPATASSRVIISVNTPGFTWRSPLEGITGKLAIQATIPFKSASGEEARMERIDVHPGVLSEGQAVATRVDLVPEPDDANSVLRKASASCS